MRYCNHNPACCSVGAHKDLLEDPTLCEDDYEDPICDCGQPAYACTCFEE